MTHCEVDRVLKLTHCTADARRVVLSASVTGRGPHWAGAAPRGQEAFKKIEDEAIMRIAQVRARLRRPAAGPRPSAPRACVAAGVARLTLRVLWAQVGNGDIRNMINNLETCAQQPSISIPCLVGTSKARVLPARIPGHTNG